MAAPTGRDATLLENKWRGKPTGTDDISVFHDEVSMATASCKVCYFVSMGGFTSERNMGAEQLMQSKTNPKMVGWEREDVEEMIGGGSPEPLLRSHVIQIQGAERGSLVAFTKVRLLVFLTEPFVA